jgi:hypothetical protein
MYGPSSSSNHSSSASARWRCAGTSGYSGGSGWLLELPLDDALGERIPGWGDEPDEVFESREFLAVIGVHALPIEYGEVVVLRSTSWPPR